ncbi:MAG: hypothetical protein OXG85_01060 [Chloroflexi bacterium]|nr:hypothetical protein [Chloroflexota bacterium]
MSGCSAVELHRRSATAAAQAVATAATEDATWAALEAAGNELQATAQTLSEGATQAAATISALASTPTAVQQATDETPPFPASAETSLYAQVPIDSDRLNIIAALAFDADGQLLAATRAGEIYALPDRDGDGLADETRLVFADDEQQLIQVAGLIVRGDALLLLHGGRHSLLRDADGDGLFDSVTHLNDELSADQSPLQASNGLVESPDGRLFTVDVNAGEILQIVLRE